MKSVALISLGCAKNLVDSENILGLLDHHQYHIISSYLLADIVIINTCGFIDASKKESINQILQITKLHKIVVVTGCLVERYYDDIKTLIPEVNLFIPIRDYYRFNELLSSLDHELQSKEGINDQYRLISTGNFSAYLKIGEGCDNRCSYCAIPLIRGGFISRPFDSIIAEAKKLAKEGYKELIVLEQDTTKYGIDFPLDKKKNIVDLLKALLLIKELDYIRLLYLYPDEISDELISLIKSEPRLTPYFDIPIQHSEDHILTDMNRRGNKEFLTKLFTKIREEIPNAILRTTIMVGFPGETNEDVINLITFMKEIKFDHLGVFTYSKEEGTSSFNMKNQVSEKEKKARLNLVMKTQQKIAYENNKKHLHEVMEGLVVGQEKQYYLLRSYFNAPDDIDGKIYFTSPTRLSLGMKVKVKIKETLVYDLIGELFNEN